MRPGARVAAAIDILSEIESGLAPADRAFAGYFRSRRYAGSKDRNAVSDLVYGVLRRRGELEWRLSQAGTPAATEAGNRARRLVMAGLAAEGRAAPEIAGLFDGKDHAPGVLDGGERDLLAVLDRRPDGALPDWASGNYPQWLDGALRARFGADLLAEMTAFNGRAPLDLRVNALKAERPDVISRLALDGIEAVPCPYSPVGVRLPEAARVTSHPAFRDGAIEVQDEGSQIVALLAGAEPGMHVIDLCAGAGGKALAMAAAMNNRGQIFACDISRRTLDRLAVRRKRAGVRNIQTHLLPDDAAVAALAAAHGLADRVLLDVPCSGSGAWRRNPDAKWRLTPDILDAHVARQRRLLEEGASLVRPGGRLIYATCSILPAENEEQIEAFLAAHGEFALRPPGEIWPAALSGDCPASDSPVGGGSAGEHPSDDWPPGDGPAQAETLILTPHRTNTDGFFVAILERR